MKVESLFSSGLCDENTYVITDEKSGLSAVIDPDLYYFKDGCRQLCEKFNITLILLTHAHFDHIYSAKELKALTGAEVCIHELDADTLADPSLNLSSQLGSGISLIPDRKLKDGDSIMLGCSEIKILLTSGHTRGSCCYICDGKIFSGDTLFHGSVGRTDFPGGSMKEMYRSIEKLKSLTEDYELYPGHGDLSTLSREKQYNPYFG